MAKLKPCPFCGGDAVIRLCDERGLLTNAKTHHVVLCRNCGVRTMAYLTRKGAFNAWNRRYWGANKSMSEIRERIHEAIKEEDNNG